VTVAEFPLGAAVTISQLAQDPHPVLASLREREPVSWIEVYGGWLVTRRDLCIEVMRDAATYTVDDPRFSTARVIGPSMLSLDGLEHRRHRTPFVDPFRAGPIRHQFLEWTRSRARSIVRDIHERGVADLRAELAAPLSVDVMSKALRLRDVSGEELLHWYEAIVAAVDEVTVGGDVPSEGADAFAALGEAVAGSVDHSPLLASVAADGALSGKELVANVAVLLFGGIVTSESTTASAFHFLLEHPEVVDDLRRDRSLVPEAVEETLRLEPAAAVVDRYATEPTQLGGVDIAAGDLVRVSLSAAGRDPAVFDDPDEFRLERANKSQHLAFAVGPHACVGIHLARIEAAAAVDAALDLLPELRSVPTGTGPVSGLIFRAPATVCAEWNVG